MAQTGEEACQGLTDEQRIGFDKKKAPTTGLPIIGAIH